MPSYQLHPEVLAAGRALVWPGAVRRPGHRAEGRCRDGSPIVTRRQRAGSSPASSSCGWRPTGRCTTSPRSGSTPCTWCSTSCCLRGPAACSCWPRRRGWPASSSARAGGCGACATRWSPAVSSTRVVVFTHWQTTVNTLGRERRPSTTALHVLVVAVALLMWMPVCGPMPELRLSLPGQMVYLFLMSIVPTVPAAWLTLAEGVVYSAYDIPERLWGISATTDQQLAGLFMKLGRRLLPVGPHHRAVLPVGQARTRRPTRPAERCPSARSSPGTTSRTS